MSSATTTKKKVIEDLKEKIDQSKKKLEKLQDKFNKLNEKSKGFTLNNEKLEKEIATHKESIKESKENNSKKEIKLAEMLFLFSKKVMYPVCFDIVDPYYFCTYSFFCLIPK